LLPYSYGMSGGLYLGGAVVLNLGFMWYSVMLYRNDDERMPMRTFGYSIVYLMMLFAFLLIDHYVPLLLSML
jgi:heme o synthase